MTAWRSLAVACIAVVLTAGCGKLLGPKATTVNVDLQASAELNPDDSGRASPMRLRLYELKSASSFNAQDFFSLYERDSAVLGADLVAREEIQIEPGMTKSFSRKLSPDTKFLGVLAPYRKVEEATWRAHFEVPQGKTTPLVLDVGKLAVRLAPPEKKRK